MSWHFENTGTIEEVTAAIDEAVANPHGMPQSVGDYIKGAVAACAQQQPGEQRSVVRVKSVGHRPIGLGGMETCEVQRVRSGPAKRADG